MNVEVLQNLVKLSKKSQKQIAQELGLLYQRFNFYVKGQREPDNNTLCALADYFGVSTDYLLGRSISDPFSERFRERVSAELSNADSADKEAAIENGFPYNELMAISEKSHPLSLSEACDIAIKMRSSVSDLLGEDEDDYYSATVKKLPTNWLSRTKKSPDSEDSEPRDEVERDIIDGLRHLLPQQQVFLLAWLKTVDALNQRNSSADLASAADTVSEFVPQAQTL